jgi:hypothetical protein
MYRELSKIYHPPSHCTNCDNTRYPQNFLLTTSSETQWVLSRLFLLAAPASVGSSSLGSCTLCGIASTFRGVAHGVRQPGGGVANSFSEATDYLQ